MRVAIAAAGTGGHVYPALAVAEELVARGADRSEVVFFGGDRMEADVVPDAGFPFIGVDIHGLRRSLSMDNVRLPGKVVRARRRILEEIRDRSLEVMVVFGGYIAGPAALAASAADIPLIVHEANADPGLANRMIVRRADTVYTAFRATAERFPGAITVGSPLRRDLVRFDRAARRMAARDRYGLAHDETVVGVVGGSLGAAFLNDVAVELGGSDRPFSILHVSGEAHFERASEAASGHERWIVIPFERSMADLYAAVDLLVCRGGALTMSEVQATATPAVVVPLPAGNAYQAGNAADLVACGAAIVVPQSTPRAVASDVMAVATDNDRIEAMGAAEPTVDHRLATDTIVDRIEALHDA